MRAATICLGILAIGVVYFLADPSKNYLPECPFYHITHLYCPGCGSQRSLHAIMHGNIGAAFGYNPLMMFGLMFFILEASLQIFKRRLAGMRSLSAHRYTPMIVLVIVLSFWILRNIPVAPFTALAP